jgi:hypothetical protein
MRTFDHFPPEATCPICGDSMDGACFLVPVDGTEDDGNEEAVPTHVACLKKTVGLWRVHRGVGILYARVRCASAFLEEDEV